MPEIVLLTGGSSGIGLATACALRDAGCKVYEISRKPAAHEGIIHLTGDVTDARRIEAAVADIIKWEGRIDILINNAGIITGNKTFDQVDIAEIDRTMLINAVAPMYVAREILPDMLRRRQGHICNITSAGGMLGNPRMAVYGASKWAAIGWSESVRIELQEQKSKVRVTTVAPYYINTGMFDGVKSPIIPILDPEKTAAKILRAIERDKHFKGIPFGFHFIRFWQFILPTRLFDFFFGKVFGIYHTMDNFVGRK